MHSCLQLAGWEHLPKPNHIQVQLGPADRASWYTAGCSLPLRTNPAAIRTSSPGNITMQFDDVLAPGTLVQTIHVLYNE